MSSLLVRLPEWLCELGRVRVRVGSREGAPNTVLEVPAGVTTVAVELSVAREGLWAEGRLEVPVALPPRGRVEIALPL